MTVRINAKDLRLMIEQMEAGGHDATELRRELAALEPEIQHKVRAGRRLRDDEEETTEERLHRRVADLFPNGIPLQEILDYDYRFTLNELREQCRRAGISIGGDKKELAAKLIAHNSSAADPDQPVYLGEGI